MYGYRVRAVNKAGPGEPSDSTHPIVAKPRNLAPKIDRTNLIDIKIKVGQKFGFDVKVCIVFSSFCSWLPSHAWFTRSTSWYLDNKQYGLLQININYSSCNLNFSELSGSLRSLFSQLLALCYLTD